MKHRSPRWAAFLGSIAIFAGVLTPSIVLTPHEARATTILPECANTSILYYLCTDVSPNTASGRIVSVVVDPTNAQWLFAASDLTGVWASSDGGNHWGRASTGLRNGVSAGWGIGGGRVNALAIDETNSQRLLYATADDDTKDEGGHPFGGLYVTTDRAASWRHVDLPGCETNPGLVGVAFNMGRGFALAKCGLYQSSDLSTWTPITVPFANGQGAFQVVGRTIYGCANQTVYRSPDLGQTWSWIGFQSYVTDPNPPYPIIQTNGPGANLCADLAIVPSDPGDQVLAIDDYDFVWLANVQSQSVSALGHVHSPDAGHFLSGATAIYTTCRPYALPSNWPCPNYDVFASDGAYFTELQSISPPSWSAEINQGVHADAWGLAVPPSYNPASGNCRIYLANDGGVYTNSGACPTSTSSWTLTSVGLHVQEALDLAGVSQSPCNTQNTASSHPCPALYFAGQDNGTWGTLDGGTQTSPGLTAWRDMGCCGDSAAVHIDPALPGQLVTTRNGCKDIYTNGMSPPSGPGNDQGNVSLDNGPPAPPNPFKPYMPEGTAPPATADFAQVMTLFGEQPAPNGDYFTVETTATNDAILRNQNPAYPSGGCGGSKPATAESAGWTTIDSSYFAAGQVTELQVSGGHTNTIVYALAGGQVYQDVVARGGWSPACSGLSFAANFFADPYVAGVLYATDIGAGKIVSCNVRGTGSWQPENDLTRLATNGGQVGFACPSDGRHGNGNMWCPLTAMSFVRDNTSVEIASLGRGGVAFTRDGGGDWIPLIGVTAPESLPGASPIDVPMTTWYDTTTNPEDGEPSLYVAMRDSGVFRVDAPFPTLTAVEIGLGGLGGSSAALVDDTTGITTPLQKDSDGVYRGTELIDANTTTSVRYHFVIDGVSSGETTHTLSASEISSGAVDFTQNNLAVTYTGDTTGDYHDPITLKSTTTVGSTPMIGATAAFTLGSQSCQGVTGSDGVASCSITLNQSSGPYTARATFVDSSDGATAASASAPFTISDEQDSTTYIGPTVILQGASGVALKGQLLEDGNSATPISGRTLTLSLGGQSCSANTGSDGTASCTLKFTGTLGPERVEASFAGDSFYLPSWDTSKSAYVFAFPSRGAFTVGDNTATAATSSTTVTWWADSWSALNSLSGGPAPAAFKGFAETVTLPTSTPPAGCGSSWNTTTGNSPPPTSGVPSYMGVLVTSKVSQAGAGVSGNTVHIVVVRVAPGYAANPMNHGTGTIVATYC